MKVLILINNDIGLYKFRKEILKRYISEGYEVTVVTPDTEGYAKKLVEEVGCKHIPHDVDRRGTNPIKDFSTFRKYLSIIKSEKPDIVFTYTSKPTIYGGMACTLTKTPYVATLTGLGTPVENPGLLRTVLITLYKLGLKKCDYLIPQNIGIVDFLAENNIKGKGRQMIIPGAGVNLDENKFEEYPDDKNGLVFVFIGRLMKDKGIGELLEAAERIHDKYPETLFRIVGFADDELFTDKVAKLEEKGVVEFLGFRNDVHELIKNSHATVLPSYHEGISNALIESASAGRPVISTNVHGCIETFDDGISGFACEAKSADSLYEQLEKFVLLSNEERKQMGVAGRRKMEKEFDRNIIVEKNLQVLKEVLNIN